jgi:hypothetical protein
MGRKVARELEEWEAMQVAGTAGSENLEAFMDDGEWLYRNLQFLVHKEPVDSGFSNRKVTEWLRFSKVSRARIERKLEADHAVERLRRAAELDALLHDAIEHPERFEDDEEPEQGR